MLAIVATFLVMTPVLAVILAQGATVVRMPRPEQRG